MFFFLKTKGAPCNSPNRRTNNNIFLLLGMILFDECAYLGYTWDFSSGHGRFVSPLPKMKLGV